MDFRVKQFRWVMVLLFVSVCFSLNACSKPKEISAQSFVGTWKSSRSNTPISMYSNGEWEIKSGEGKVMQYGVWQVVGQNVMWSYKEGGRMFHDINPLVSLAPTEFKVREQDSTVTTFTKLE